jgi:hypothetical protein
MSIQHEKNCGGMIRHARNRRDALMVAQIIVFDQLRLGESSSVTVGGGRIDR